MRFNALHVSPILQLKLLAKVHIQTDKSLHRYLTLSWIRLYTLAYLGFSYYCM